MRAGRNAWLFVGVIAVAAALWYRSSVFEKPTTRPMGSIVVVTGGSGPYWQTIAGGARAAARDHDVDLRIEMPKDDENVQQQTQILSGLDLTGVDGVAISPLDAEGQTSLINRMVDDAVVVTFDSDAPNSTRDTYIGTSNLAAGRRAARLVQEAIPDGGKVAVILANLTKDNLIERRAGFEDVINQRQSSGQQAAPTYEVVGFLVDEGNDEKCRELIAQTLDEHPDVACLVGMNAYHGPILLSVLKEQEKLGKVMLVTFDDEAETLAGVESGHIFATVVQDPYLYGYSAVEKLATICRGDVDLRPLAGAKSTYNISTQAVGKDNLAEFQRQLAERLGQGQKDREPGS